MTKAEIKHIQDTEELLYDRLRSVERKYGNMSISAIRARAVWGVIYDLMDDFHIPLKEKDVEIK